jgi:hypothetical protein
VATGTQSGNPEVTAVAPYETPMTATDRQMTAMPRARSRSNVLHIERMDVIVERSHGVRQGERMDDGANR